MNTLAIFGSAFLLVFLLGMQSLVVNAGHKRLAFLNSFAIGSANLLLLKLVPESGVMEMAAYLCGGPFGIVLSIEVFKWFKNHRKGVTK